MLINLIGHDKGTWYDKIWAIPTLLPYTWGGGGYLPLTWGGDFLPYTRGDGGSYLPYTRRGGRYLPYIRLSTLQMKRETTFLLYTPILYTHPTWGGVRVYLPILHMRGGATYLPYTWGGGNKNYPCRAICALWRCTWLWMETAICFIDIGWQDEWDRI